MKIAIGADHGGFETKEFLVEFLSQRGFEVRDFGTKSGDSTDYPDYAHPVAKAILDGEYDYGILVCGTGNGMAITANKHQGIRAGLAWTEEIGALVKQHNNANIICLPARFISKEMASKILAAFFDAEFEGDRHQRRIDKISC